MVVVSQVTIREWSHDNARSGGVRANNRIDTSIRHWSLQSCILRIPRYVCVRGPINGVHAPDASMRCFSDRCACSGCHSRSMSCSNADFESRSTTTTLVVVVAATVVVGSASINGGARRSADRVTCNWYSRRICDWWYSSGGKHH